ncbi:hypothetical protein ABTZ57_42825, partial [Streptomyces sp. NPDC094048]
MHVTFEARVIGREIGAVAEGADARPIRGVEFVALRDLPELGFNGPGRGGQAVPVGRPPFTRPPGTYDRPHVKQRLADTFRRPTATSGEQTSEDHLQGLTAFQLLTFRTVLMDV